MFNFDFQKLIYNLLPSFLRSEKMQAWLNALVFPVKTLHAKFLAYRDETLFSLSHNGQVLSLEDLLNRIFNPDDIYPRIYISDGPRKAKTYLYNESENKSTRLHNLGESYPPVYLFNQQESTGFDFTVWVNNSIEFDYNRMYSLIAKHKAAGFQFQIKTY